MYAALAWNDPLEMSQKNYIAFREAGGLVGIDCHWVAFIPGGCKLPKCFEGPGVVSYITRGGAFHVHYKD